MARGKKPNVPDAERDAAGDAVYLVGDVLAGGTIVLTILILAGLYYVCPRSVTDVGLCVQVTRLGLTSFIAHLFGIGSIVSVTAQRIYSRLGRASVITLNSPEEN